MKRSLLLIAVLIGMCMQFAIAQDKKAVSGTVQDEKGNALPGVTVAEKGTTNGGITDANGNFSIRVNPNATLTFSFLGFLPKEISVANAKTFTVVLAEDSKNLNEFVVTGFGTKKKHASWVTLSPR
ncbi:carboxypeptidase-like regulatory domain-containing protein [Chitinophaga sedimenti]|uniref:carboxypeptidase-like regulatory domain-containing protein n=1 Tax=Chitinophaga sedimenti TaxID=2033606 RepID=UPI0020067044|nr:carboxypeptidase-like regulatory domain-containing protein [Chitinophaga sedimenti]MCK7560140.1 carboxypeptidase-like regulatory domain-containing protein [Chitinophaga sedimenti]